MIGFFQKPSLGISMLDAPGSVDPRLETQDIVEIQSDPLLRSLYFGTAQTPGFFNQLQQAATDRLQTDIPLRETIGLSPIEERAIRLGETETGAFDRFLGRQEDLLGDAQQQYLTGLETLRGAVGRAYDPTSASKFMDPFEDAVVQQVIEDFNRKAAIEDQGMLADDIARAGESAFGSRGRLKREEVEAARGEGLGRLLSGIRSQGFDRAMDRSIADFGREQAATERLAAGETGLGGLLRGLGSDVGGLGRERQNLVGTDIGRLLQLGGLGRGIQDLEAGRRFQQQTDQQALPLQTLGLVGGLLPGYEASQSRISSGYGLPPDPKATGLGAAFSAYGQFAGGA